MRGLIFAMVIGGGLPAFVGSARAQLSDSEGSARWIAQKIAANGNGTSEDYLDYAGRLAKTISQYSAATQSEIFGFLPPSGAAEANSAAPAASLPGSVPTSPASALANPALTSGELFDILLQNSPLSDQDILKALERAPSLEKNHLTDLLKAQGKLSKGTLISALASAKLKLPPADLKALLISQTPLDRVVLKKVAGTSNLSSSDIAEVLAAQ